MVPSSCRDTRAHGVLSKTEHPLDWEKRLFYVSSTWGCQKSDVGRRKLSREPHEVTELLFLREAHIDPFGFQGLQDHRLVHRFRVRLGGLDLP